jgi:hypothetical protein
MKSNSGLRYSPIYSLKEFIFETLCSLNEDVTKSTTGTSGTNPTSPGSLVDKPQDKPDNTNNSKSTRPKLPSLTRINNTFRSGVGKANMIMLAKSSGKPKDKIAGAAQGVIDTVFDALLSNSNQSLKTTNPNEIGQEIKKVADGAKKSLNNIKDTLDGIERGVNDNTDQNQKNNKSPNSNPLLTPKK